MRVTIRVSPRCVRREDLAGSPAAFKYGAARRGVADLLRDLKLAERRSAASRRIAKCELRGRNRIHRHRLAFIEHDEALFGHADDDMMPRVFRGARCAEE